MVLIRPIDRWMIAVTELIRYLARARVTVGLGLGFGFGSGLALTLTLTLARTLTQLIRHPSAVTSGLLCSRQPMQSCFEPALSGGGAVMQLCPSSDLQPNSCPTVRLSRAPTHTYW